MTQSRSRYTWHAYDIAFLFSNIFLHYPATTIATTYMLESSLSFAFGFDFPLRYKFHDVKTALGGAIKEADFFFFMDADTGFNEDTRLIDVGADLSVVEHPMYPRDHMGWCDKPTGQAMCGTCNA